MRLIPKPHFRIDIYLFQTDLGWSDGAMVLGKLPVPGRPTNLEYGRAVGAGGGCLDIFLSSIISLFFLSNSLWETARYRLKYCLKGPFLPQNNQPTNQTDLFHPKFMISAMTDVDMVNLFIYSFFWMVFPCSAS